MVEKVWDIKVHSNPDCIVSIENGYLIGTYELNEETRVKTGSILAMVEMEEKNRMILDKGIMDIKKIDQTSFLASTSEGGIVIFSGENLEIKADSVIHDFCTSYISISDGICWISYLDGTVSAVDINTLQTLYSIKPNAYEIWSIFASENEVYIPTSIGKLEIWDKRLENSAYKLNIHTEDICSIGISDNCIITGSYDGDLAFLDKRTYQIIEKLHIGGGIWRFINTDSYIACACMYEGYKFYWKASKEISTIPTSSIAYGLDQISPTSFIGCSFYDREVSKLTLKTVFNST
ncbi:unnamed protein product [Blepharisma stoltei]|uniref:Uncharacterized protein n=1 Tax=Blepharisma stoltei TaxID=1481888 RepID=A0AAU9JP95_9CILI|nr:unnamed protein product [Blepharisma stoltei]